MTRLVVLDPIRFLPAGVQPIDIDTDFHDADVISVALPSFPLASINQAQSFISITSNPEGDFDTGPTDAVAFNQSTVALINGDSEFRFARSLLTTVNKKALTGIRFQITATAHVTVKIASVRLLSLDWLYAPVDFNTLWGRIERPVSLTASAATASAFPIPATVQQNSVARGGDFETAADLTRYSGTNGTLALDTTTKTNGISSAKFTMTGDNTVAPAKLIGEADVNGADPGTNILGAPIVSNNIYTVRAKVKGPNGRNVRLGFRILDNTGALLATTTSGTTPMDATWQSLSYTLDLKGYNASGMRAGVEVDCYGANTEIFHIDELILSYAPAEWPVVYRADIPAGSSDPKPIDVAVTTMFQAGSLTNTVPGTSESDLGTQNEIALYFREQPVDYFTQLDLDGSMTQADLNALGHQPDYGQALYTGRSQSNLEQYSQSDLDFYDQFRIERLPDSTASVFIEVHLSWDSNGGSLEIKDSEDRSYLFPDLDIAAHKFYIMWVDLQANSMRVQIYEATQLGDTKWDVIVLDTQTITDDSFFVRRKGRFGWWARFQDGDAYIENIRSRGLNYAEYRSAPFESFTPVVGANLIIGGTINKELYNGVSPAPWGGRIDLDPSKSSSGAAIKVTNTNNSPLQGLMTNSLLFDDFDETTIDLKVWFPKTALDRGSRLEIFLLGENVRLVPLHVPDFQPDQWQKLRIFLKGQMIQTGHYRLVMIQTEADIPTTWWVDEISIRTRVTSWAGRAHQGGAWNIERGEWVPFLDTINNTYDGIVFADRATKLQIRGRARRQDARISQIKATPKYAELGRFVWDEQRATYAAPTAAITSVTASGKTATATATQDSTIAVYQWDFSDGTRDFGPVVDHTFAASGLYSVTLTVLNTHGVSAMAASTVSV